MRLCSCGCNKPARQQMFSAAEVALMLKSIKADAEAASGKWEGTCQEYRRLIDNKVRNLGY